MASQWVKKAGAGGLKAGGVERGVVLVAHKKAN